LRKFEKIKVSEYSGYKGEEKPLSFTYNGKTYKINKIISTKYEKDIITKREFNVFVVEGEKGNKFLLYFDTNQNRWFLLAK